MSSIAKMRLLRIKFEQHFMSALQKNKSTHTSGSVFAEKIEKAKKTKFELEVKKVVDCFLDGHYNYDSNLVSFKTKSSQQTIFFVTVSKSNECSHWIKILGKNEIPNQKNSSLVRFWNKIFTTCRIWKQNFHNVSNFKTKFLQLDRFYIKSFKTRMHLWKINLFQSLT